MKKFTEWLSESYFYHHGIFSVLLLAAITVTVIAFAEQSYELVYAEDQSGWSLTNKKYSMENPAIARSARGDFLIVWQEERGGDWDIFAVRGNQKNNRVGNPMQVNRHRKGDQKNPKAILDPEGNFKILWESVEEGRSGIFGQRFLRSGKRLGAEFQTRKMPEEKSLGRDFAVASNEKGKIERVWTEQEKDGKGARLYFQAASLN